MKNLLIPCKTPREMEEIQFEKPRDMREVQFETPDDLELREQDNS